ncbi:MAG TPA: DUF84 family protein [Candidatus Paceibacterota bacterium]|nr:DUF84 family protein [Candidatus Paceibacterota bacterium]
MTEKQPLEVSMEGNPVKPERFELPSSIVVTSGSAIKINTAAKALSNLFPNRTFNVSGVKVPSGVDEQPVGDMTEQGALNRLANARAGQDEVARAETAVVSIENGIFETADGWEDRAIAVIQLPNGKPIAHISRGVSFPTEAVEEARRRGFKEHTVGSVLVEQYAKQGITIDKQDPHTTLTNGQFTREAQMIEALQGALAKAAS